MIAALTPGLSSGCICSMQTILHLTCTKRQLNVFPPVENVLMTAWTRLEAEIDRQNKSLKSLQDLLGVSKQAMGHWRARGIPAKYIDDCASFIGKAPFWLKNGFDAIDAAKSPSNVIQVPVNIEKFATENIATLEQITEALAGYLMQMDDDARDDAGDALRKLAHKPENHARTAAMLATAFHSGKRKSA